MKKLLISILTILGIGLSFCNGEYLSTTPITYFDINYGGDDGVYGPQYTTNNLSYNIICSPGRGAGNTMGIYLYSGSNTPVYSLSNISSFCLYYGDSSLSISYNSNPGYSKFFHLYVKNLDLSGRNSIPDLGFYYVLGDSFKSLLNAGENWFGNESNNVFVPLVNRQYHFYASDFLPSFAGDTTDYVINYDSSGFLGTLSSFNYYYYVLFPIFTLEGGCPDPDPQEITIHYNNNQSSTTISCDGNPDVYINGLSTITSTNTFTPYYNISYRDEDNQSLIESYDKSILYLENGQFKKTYTGNNDWILTVQGGNNSDFNGYLPTFDVSGSISPTDTGNIFNNFAENSLKFTLSNMPSYIQYVIIIIILFFILGFIRKFKRK